jgi:hypothetical protein
MSDSQRCVDVIARLHRHNLPVDLHLARALNDMSVCRLTLASRNVHERPVDCATIFKNKRYAAP